MFTVPGSSWHQESPEPAGTVANSQVANSSHVAEAAFATTVPTIIKQQSEGVVYILTVTAAISLRYLTSQPELKTQSLSTSSRSDDEEMSENQQALKVKMLQTICATGLLCSTATEWKQTGWQTYNRHLSRFCDFLCCCVAACLCRITESLITLKSSSTGCLLVQVSSCQHHILWTNLELTLAPNVDSFK